MTWKSYALVSGAGLLATYLVSAPPTLAPQRTPPRPAVTGSPGSAIDIEAQAARLQVRARGAPAFEEPSRNPFRFSGRPARSPGAAAPPIAAAPAPEAPIDPVPQPPLIQLQGVATLTVDGVRQRTAFLITDAGRVTVAEGDTVAGQYRVSRIDERAIELVAGDGSVRRLSLRP
jgi:hypothetical protein